MRNWWEWGISILFDPQSLFPHFFSLLLLCTLGANIRLCVDIFVLFKLYMHFTILSLQLWSKFNIRLYASPLNKSISTSWYRRHYLVSEGSVWLDTNWGNRAIVVNTHSHLISWIHNWQASIMCKLLVITTVSIFVGDKRDCSDNLYCGVDGMCGGEGAHCFDEQRSVRQQNNRTTRKHTRNIIVIIMIYTMFLITRGEFGSWI